VTVDAEPQLYNHNNAERRADKTEKKPNMRSENWPVLSHEHS